MNSTFQEFSQFHNFLTIPSPVIDIENSVSDCESGITGSSSTTSSCADSFIHKTVSYKGLTVELSEDERSFQLIRRRFIAGVGEKAVVMSIHRRNWSENSLTQARVHTYKVYSNALESKYCGPSNEKFGWYGGDKGKIEKILAHGFSYQDVQTNNNAAVFLSPDNSPAQSVEDSREDEDGLRHMLLCRVLLGRSELVHIGSGQTHPSSDEFDSGLDSYENPKKYVIWSSKMNTHVLPEYVVTFKVKGVQSPSKGGVCRVKNTNNNGIRMPTSPWISFPSLISVLAKYLVSDAISLISKYHKDYKEKKMSRAELIHRVRQIAGDKLLIAVIKSFKSTNKETRMPFGLSSQYKKNTNN